MRNFYPYLFGHLVHSVVLFKLSKFYSRLFGAGGGGGGAVLHLRLLLNCRRKGRRVHCNSSFRKGKQSDYIK